MLATLATLLAALAPAVPASGAKKGGGTINETRNTNAAIPDRGPGANAPYGQLVSTIEVGKQFKGRRIRDVDVTVQTTGVGASAALELEARLSAPNGASCLLFLNLIGFVMPNNSIGPMTLDDEAPLGIGFGAPLNSLRLYQPWAGRTRPFCSLFVMDDGPARGTWTLRIFDKDDTDLSVLSSWGLRVLTGRPFLTK